MVSIEPKKTLPRGCWCRLSTLSVIFFFFDVKVFDIV